MSETTTRRSNLRTAAAEAAGAAELAELLLAERARLREANDRQPLGLRACRALTEAADAVIQRLLQLSLPADPAQRDATRPLIAVVATGGYGRRELCPYSDIDVTFIVGEDEDPALDATVRQMFLLLMETFGQRVGLKVGYGYRSPADVAQLDHQTQTALLDMRVVAGSHGLAERFQAEVLRHVWPAAFIRQKVKERRLLWERHGGTLYRIEPEVREGPGGLRDLHLAEWVAALSFPSTRGDVWRQLQRLGIVSRRDEHDASDARDFLLTVRNWMHWHTGRPADLLIRERQELLSEALRFQDDDQASRVERFMERYYAHAESVNRITSFVIERCLGERLSLTDELACAGTELLPAFPWLQVRSPRFLVELGQHYQEHGLVPGHDLRRMIAQHLDSVPELSVDGEAVENFLGLLRAPAPPAVPAPNQWAQPLGTAGVWATLKLLADLGVLQRLVPEIGVAYPRVPFDQVHRHTIGYHSLDAVRALETLRASEEERLLEFRRAFTEVAAPELLFLATLLHDIGKVFCTSGHAETGAGIVRQICARLRLDEAATAKVATLVRHHLLMSETAQLRDLTHEKTILDFVQVIDSTDLLNMLLLLTYADMEATGVLTPVKARFLEELSFRAEPLLQGGAPPPAADEAARKRRFKSRLSRSLASANLTPDQIRDHTEEMPVAYLLNTRPELIAVHIRMMEALQNQGPQDGPVVEFDNELGTDITTIHVCTVERPEPGLLSLLAGVLYAHEIGVHGAQVFTRGGEPAIALDTLWADFHGRGIPPLKRMELEQDLIATLKSGDVEAVFARYRKQLPPPIPPIRIRVDNAAAENDSVVEIQAEDQPALLYRIARSMAALGWNIHSARISTRGDIARDAFYVVGPDGGKLQEGEAELVQDFLDEFSRRLALPLELVVELELGCSEPEHRAPNAEHPTAEFDDEFEFEFDLNTRSQVKTRKAE